MSLNRPSLLLMFNENLRKHKYPLLVSAGFIHENIVNDRFLVYYLLSELQVFMLCIFNFWVCDHFQVLPVVLWRMLIPGLFLLAM